MKKFKLSTNYKMMKFNLKKKDKKVKTEDK